MGLLRLLLGTAPSNEKRDEPTADAPEEAAGTKQKALLKKVLERLDSLLGVEKAPIVTYPEAIRYFVTDRPDDERVTNGVLVRRPDISGSLLIWLFLDSDGEPLRDGEGKLYGRKLIAIELDEELRECLGDNGVLLVK